MIDAKDIALIIEGGGMRATATAGAIATLITEEVQFGWVGGISAGASHAANLLSRDARRARDAFVELCTHPEFGGWGSLVRGTGYFNAEFIYERAVDRVMPFDFEAFDAHPAQRHIEAVNARTGETVAWTREDFRTASDVMVRVRASSTLPGLMRMPVIDGEPYVDGALGPSGGLLIDAAHEAGFRKFAVLSTRPQGYRKPPVSRPGAVKALFRHYPAVAAATLERPGRYNASMELIERLESKGSAIVFRPDFPLLSTGEKDASKIASNYREGLEHFKKEWPRWGDFMS